MRSLQQQLAYKKRDHEAMVFKERHGKSAGAGAADEEGSVELRRSLEVKYSERERLLYERKKKEANETKAKHLKAEIRKLHIETSVLEKELRERTEAELSRIQEAAASEENHLKKRQEIMMREISELSGEKSELLAQLKSLTEDVCGFQNRIRETKGQTNEKQGLASSLDISPRS
jgi:chromosome segregation ATPase